VKISDEAVGGRIGISIADNGRGIRKEDLPLIFDRFYRSETSRTSSGFGLGLSIAKVIAEAHQGEICVKSQLGSGSTFTLLLPAAVATN
jgi:signal transduction histidine kinase